MTEFGFVINTVIVVVVSFHLALETLHWVSSVRTSVFYIHLYMDIHVQCFPQSMEMWQLSTLRDMSNTSEQSIACACVHDYTAVWPHLYSMYMYMYVDVSIFSMPDGGQLHHTMW